MHVSKSSAIKYREYFKIVASPQKLFKKHGDPSFRLLLEFGMCNVNSPTSSAEVKNAWR